MFLCIPQIFAQANLTVVYKNGTEESFYVNESGKLYFDNASIFIVENEINTTDINLSDIRKVLVSTPVGIEDMENSTNNNTYYFYPNPVQDFINIKCSKQEKLQITIFSINGNILFKGDYLPESTIDLSFLKTGLYFIKINEQTFKLSKL